MVRITKSTLFPHDIGDNVFYSSLLVMPNTAMHSPSNSDSDLSTIEPTSCP